MTFTPPKPSQIKPAIKGESDKFSWRLYSWVRRHCTHGTGMQILEVPSEVADRPEFIIGDMDEDGWIHGTRVNAILCGNGKRWAYPPSYFDGPVTDVTEQFWREYLRIGVCRIHDSGHVWVEKKLTRTCSTCGRVQVKRVKIEKRDIWINGVQS